MKQKYYCKKCGIIVELEDFDPQFGELKRVFCSNCRNGVRMWKVIPKEKHFFVEDDTILNYKNETKRIKKKNN